MIICFTLPIVEMYRRDRAQHFCMLLIQISIYKFYYFWAASLTMLTCIDAHH